MYYSDLLLIKSFMAKREMPHGAYCVDMFTSTRQHACGQP